MPSSPENELQYDGFSWLVEDQLAGLPQPGRAGSLDDDLAFLANRNIALLASVNEVAPPVSDIEAAGIASLWWPVDDFQPPTQGQLEEFVAVASQHFESGERVGVHCTYGLGRTGTFLAAWLVWDGLDAEAAIAEVRARRPGSIETRAQEDAVRTFWLNRPARR